MVAYFVLFEKLNGSPDFHSIKLVGNLSHTPIPHRLQNNTQRHRDQDPHTVTPTLKHIKTHREMYKLDTYIYITYRDKDSHLSQTETQLSHTYIRRNTDISQGYTPHRQSSTHTHRQTDTHTHTHTHIHLSTLYEQTQPGKKRKTSPTHLQASENKARNEIFHNYDFRGIIALTPQEIRKF